MDSPRDASSGFVETVVREMARRDLDRVARIEARSFRSPWSREMIAVELGHDWSTSLVATRSAGGGEEEIVGFALYWTVVDEVHVLDLAVDPSHLRRGVALALVGAMIERAERQGARMISLEVRRSNHAARSLYEKKGFRPSGVRRGYYSQEGEDAIIMELEL